MSAKPTTTPTKNEELKGQSLLVRSVAATLSVKVPSAREITIRGAMLRRATADIPTMPPGLLIRFYEAACDCDFPDADVVAFRLACARILARVLDLAEYKQPAPARA
jgi:hypothetical protein